ILCQGDSVNLHGEWLNKNGVFVAKFNTENGCDSIYETKVIVNPSYINISKVGLCGGDSILFDGVYRKVTGQYVSNGQTIHGCDSIRILNLSVDSVILEDNYLSICQGDSILFNGVFENTAGVYKEKFVAVKGCDSIVSNYLSINKWDTSYLSSSFCFG